jgi:hypothetical protein
MLGDPFCDLVNLNSNTHDVEYTKLYYNTKLFKNTLHEDISHITHLTMERAHVIKIDHTKIKFVEYLIATILPTTWRFGLVKGFLILFFIFLVMCLVK